MSRIDFSNKKGRTRRPGKQVIKYQDVIYPKAWLWS
nr:MAG TPA_asm: hypothetical protein [Caudoviricetes sp.]